MDETVPWPAFSPGWYPRRVASSPEPIAADAPTWAFRLQPREWLRLAPLVRERPADVTLGARVFFSIGGHDERPTYERFQRTAEGAALVRNGTPYPALLTDLEGLRALPAGTLGREYVRELDERGIHPTELARQTASAHAGRPFTREHAYVRDRVRDVHDLLHTLTGYGIDVNGEAGVLAFTFGQTGNKGWAVLTVLNQLGALAQRRFDGWLTAWRAYRKGRRARFVPAVQDWERLLQTPLEAVRRELDIPPPAPYRRLEFEEVFGPDFAADRA